MEIPSLKQRLAAYHQKKYPEWIPSGEMQRIVSLNTTYSPQNVGRRLRELAEEGVLEVKYVHNHAHYRWKMLMTVEEIWNAI